MYKKRLLNSAIALALATTGSAAFAVVNIDPPSSGQQTYASETLNPASIDGLVDDNDGAFTPNNLGNIDVEGELGWSIGSGSGDSRFLRFDFFEAVLEEPLTPASLTFNITSGVTPGVSLSAGGTVGDDFVIFEVTNPSTTLPINNDDSFSLDIDEVKSEDEQGDVSKNDAQVRYRAFEEGLLANNAGKFDAPDPSETFKDEQVGWFNWTSALPTVACQFNPGEEGLIDTIDRAFWEVAPFQPAFSRQIAVAQAQVTVSALNPIDGTTVEFEDYFPSGNASFDVAGNFQGIQSVTVDDGTNPPVSFPVPPASGTPFAPTGISNPYSGFFGTNGFASAGLFLTNTTDRDGDGQPDEMVPSLYEISFAQPVIENTADFIVDPLGSPCGETIASGSRDRLDYTASPDGAGVNESLFRIVNPSDEDGEVVMRVINDAGGFEEFDIDLIDGIDSNVLAAGESTPVIRVEEAFGVAVAQGLATPAPASDGSKRDKLRIEVRGGFGQDSFDGNLNFNLLFDNSDGGGQFGGVEGNGPSGAGLLRVRGQEQQGRSANGIQIQGFMLNDENTVIPYNDR